MQATLKPMQNAVKATVGLRFGVGQRRVATGLDGKGMRDFMQLVRGIQDRLGEQAEHREAQDQAPKRVKKEEGSSFHRAQG